MCGPSFEYVTTCELTFAGQAVTDNDHLILRRHAAREAHDACEVIFGNVRCEGTCNGVQDGCFARHGDGARVSEQFVDVGHIVVDGTVCNVLTGCAITDNGCNAEEHVLLVHERKFTVQHPPATGRGECVVLGVHVVEQGRTVTQERSDRGINVILHCPGDPIINVGFEGVVREAVLDRRRHLVNGGTINGAITCRNDDGVGRQLVSTDATVEDELEQAVHGGFACIGQLFDEEHNGALIVTVRIILRHTVAGAVAAVGLLDNFEATANVDGVEQVRAQFKDLGVEVSAKLIHDVRFTDTGRAPDHGRNASEGVSFEFLSKAGRFDCSH